MGDTLQIKTLGGLSIAKNGEAISGFASRKAEALLVYLACNPRTHPREVLAELLWDDRSQRQALANLRVVLSSLRKEVGGYVEIARTTASIAPAAELWLDAAELEAAADRLREQEGHLSSEVAEEMSAALDGYEGDFLEGFFLPEAGGFEAWVTAERERLHRLALEALQRLGQWHLEQGDYAEARATSSRLLELDPLAEAGHRQLMEVLARSGQRSQALAQYEMCREVLRKELGVEPAAETEALYQAIRAGEVAKASRATGATEIGSRQTTLNLPHKLTPIIGREPELADLRGLLGDDQVRLVTITGPGGIGKTRLALEVARELSGGFADGAVFVQLAPLSETEAIVPALAQALRFKPVGGPGETRSDRQQLLDYLRGKELLLVLDNFDHLLKAAPLLVDIMNTAPQVKLLVTSRQRLKLQVERLYPLQGLKLSRWESLAEAQRDPAARLFVEYGQRIRPGFALQAEDLGPLRRMFQLVEGMPLAIILAAAWLELLSPAEIAAEVGRSLDFLEADYRDLPPRQRSMRAVFDATWQRLSEGEREAFAALSVFRGGFDLEAARAVADARPQDLRRLMERSLLARGEGRRFQVHELLRQFASEQLSRTQEQEEAVHERHSRYFCEFLQKREEDLKGARNLEAEAEISADIENVRTAWKWAVEHNAELVYQAQTALNLFFMRRGRMQEALTAFRQARVGLENRDRLDARRMAELFSWGSRMYRYRSSELSEALLRRATGYLEEARGQGEDVRAEEAVMLMKKGYSSRTEGEALALLKESLSLHQELGRRWDMAQVHWFLGLRYYRSARFRKAHEHLELSMQLYERLGDRKFALWPKMLLAARMAEMGRLNEAEEGFREALTYAEGLDDEYATANVLENLGEFLNLSGRFEEALPVLDRSRAHFTNLGLPSFIGSCSLEQCTAALHLGRYDEVRREAKHLLDSEGKATAQFAGHQGEFGIVQGQAALALARLDEARAHLQGSLKSWRALNVPGGEAASRAGLGYVALHGGDSVTARDLLADALQTASDRRLFRATLHALPAVALLLAELGDEERAVELYALASTYDFVANSRWFEDVAGRHINAVAETMPPDVVAAARARGQAWDLWETVEELLQELEDMEL